MSKIQIIQEPFLNALRKERTPVHIYLTSGKKLHGYIDSFDQFVILLKTDASKNVQMLYKHAILTIAPLQAVNFVKINNEKEPEMTSSKAETSSVEE